MFLEKNKVYPIIIREGVRYAGNGKEQIRRKKYNGVWAVTINKSKP